MSLHFSLLTPAEGREREAAQQRAAGPYAEHQWLWTLFAAPEGTPRDFLFRRREKAGLQRYYLLSPRVPQPRGAAWQVRSTPYDPRVEVGDRLRFELRANPVVTHARDGKSRRHDVVMEAKKKLLAERGFSRWQDWQGDDKPPLQRLVHESCAAWLAQRGARHGFEADPEALCIDGYAQHAGRRDGSLKFSSVDFSGELTVIDAGAFGAALRGGIGHAKAFGCGLLLVRRLG